MLALAEDHGPDSNPAGVLEGVAEQSVRFNARLAVRLEVVRLVEVEVRDLVGRYESANVERLRGGHPRLLEVLVGDDNILALRVFVALLDFTPRHLDPFLAAEALVLNAGVVLLVQQVERERLAALDRRVQIYGDGDKAAAEDLDRKRGAVDRQRRHSGGEGVDRHPI